MEWIHCICLLITALKLSLAECSPAEKESLIYTDRCLYKSSPSYKAMQIKWIVSQAFFLGKPMRDAAFYFILQATPTIR